MTNNVAPFKNGGGVQASNLQALAGAMSKVQQSTPGRGSGMPILRMGRDGVWMFGPDNVEPQPGSHWAVNPFTMKHGFVAWVRSQDQNAKPSLAGEKMVSVFEDKPDAAGLPNYENAPWADQLTAELYCLNGDDEGITVEFKTSSVGGLDALKKLTDQIRRKASDGDAAVVPVVELLNSDYPHKKYGKIYTPVLSVIDWLTGQEEDPGAATAANQQKAAAPEPAPAPAPTRSRPPVGAPAAPAAAKPAPTRKRAPVAAAAASAPIPQREADDTPDRSTQAPPFTPDEVKAAAKEVLTAAAAEPGRRRRVAN